MTPVARALDVVRAWGVRAIEACPIPARDGDIVLAPTTRAYIERSTGGLPLYIWWAEPNTDAEAACALIHEAAHVLLGVDPMDADEIDSPMLAWELDMQIEAGVLDGRGAWMADFDTGTDWGAWRHAPGAVTRRIMQWSRWRAMEWESGS